MNTLLQTKNLTIVLLSAALFSVTGGVCRPCAAGNLTLHFNQAAGTVRDSNGIPTGFTSRLPGASEAPLDSALLLDPLGSRLQISTRVGDPNGGASVGNLSMPGIQLSELGYTGNQDFAVHASFQPLPGLDPIDQVGIYVGNDIGNFTRAGVIQFDQPEYLAVHTSNSADNNGLFFGAGINIAGGMEVTIQRIARDWQYYIDGVEWQPNSINTGAGFPVDPTGMNGSPDLDASTDLYVGVFALTVFNSNTKMIYLDRFEVTVVPEPTGVALASTVIMAAVFSTRRRSAF